MMRIVPTPARASREASADPVAPQPTMAMHDAVSWRWPSGPIPRKSTCREYRSSSSKEVISSTLTNHYDGCHALCKTGTGRKGRVMQERSVRQSSAGYNIVLYGFIELDIASMRIRESVCH